MTLDNIVEEINKANTIAILTHETTDGDAIGSSLAMYNALKDMGKNPDVIIPEYPKIFKFLPGAENILEEPKEGEYDLTIALDCADSKRLSKLIKVFETSKSTISIDHHSMNPMFADINYVDPVSPATCQILVIVLQYLQIKITKEIGTCLLTGIITDTGGFKYAGVSKETFEFVGGLLNLGINVSEIYKKVLQIKTRANFELTRIALNRLEFLEDNKVTFTYITLEEQARFGNEEGAHEGIVEAIRDIEGVEVAIFLREKEEGFKVSLRSNEYVNVSDICFLFGGGGHTKAAGCKIQGTPEQIKQKLLTIIKKELR